MIYLASDHRGYQLKEKIKGWLEEWRYKYEDIGNKKYDPEDDYPDFAAKVAVKIQSSREAEQQRGRKRKSMRLCNLEALPLGIIVCGSGIGMDITANKFPGVRCGLGFSVEQVKRGRQEDDINCLALPADFITGKQAKEMVKVLLETEFVNKEKYIRRIRKITNLNKL